MKATILSGMMLLFTLCVVAQEKEAPITGTKIDLMRKARTNAFLKEEKGHHRGFTKYHPKTPVDSGWSIGTNFSSLQEDDGGPSLFVEYRWDKHYEVGLMGTCVLYGGLFAAEGSNRKGMRLQPYLKYYWQGRTHKLMPFIGIMGLFTSVNYKVPNQRPQREGRPFNFALGDGEEMEHKRMAGAALIVGFKKYLDGPERRILMEIYLGVGFKQKYFPGRSAAREHYVETPELHPSTVFNYYQYQYNSTYAYLPGGIKFGYRF